MKKVFLVSALFLLGAFLFPSKTSAQLSCPSVEMTCSELDSKEGCLRPCIRVVTQSGGPAGRTAPQPAQCQCQQPKNEEDTVPLGQPCQIDDDCAPPGEYCWGEFHQAPVCHRLTPGEELSQRQSGETETNDPTCTTSAGEDGIDTAIGCIPISDTNAFIGFILRWAIGVGGGIAFLLIVYSAFMIMTSTGNPERLKAGQELLTSAIAGLIMLIFSIFILRVIGVDILKLPGFGQPDINMLEKQINK